MIAKGKRLLAFAMGLCLLLCLLPACGEAEVKNGVYTLPDSFETVDTGVVAENTKYSLEWDDEYKSIMMVSKSGQRVWGTTPVEYYKSGETHNFVSSPVIIQVLDTVSLGVNSSRAYDGCIEEGNLSAKKIDNGIEVTYYFDEYSISIPVQYVLREDSMSIRVDTKCITEGDKFQLVNVSLAPYACALEIPEKENEPADALEDYLFLPVGTGALVSPLQQDDKRELTGEVYGTDASRFQPYEYYTPESIRMPVYGVKKGQDALVAILEDSAELAGIEMTAGNKRMEYSNVAGSFNVRGYDIYAEDRSYIATMTTRYSKEMVDTTLSVGFYPLSGDDASYVGMANTYRDYLLDNGLTKKALAQNPYALSILGNVTTKSLAFGVPYSSAKSMTTFAEAGEIIKDMAAQTNSLPAVQLLGYGTSGLDIGQIAGGFKFAGVSGSKKDYAALTEYATQNKIPLFTDFDMIFFNKSGNGFSASSDVAKTATLHKSEVYHRMLALRAQDKDAGAYRLINRSQLIKAMDKLLNKGEKLGVTGYSFSTLGVTAYSDYAQEEHRVKGNMGQDVKSMFASLTKAGHTVATDNANDYAAVSSDTLFNVEVNPRYRDAVDMYVPFYQIVFKGYVPMYSEALNLTANYDVSVLRALASGVGLGYTVLENYDVSFAAANQTNLHTSLYSARKQQIAESVKKYADYYKAIADATITNYTVLDNGVTVTTFSNGVVAYTNETNTKQTYANGELAAMGFAYVQGGTNG